MSQVTTVDLPGAGTPNGTAANGQPPTNQTPATPAQPERLYAGKYKTVEEMEKGYLEVQKKLGGGGTGSLTIEQGEATAEPKPEALPENAGIGEVLKRANLTETAIADQFTKERRLTDDQYTAIRKAMPGASKAVIDEMVSLRIERAQAAIESSVSKAREIAGGQQQLDALRTWAATKGNMDADRLTRLNDAVKRDPSFYPEMIAVIQSEYSRKVGAGGTSGLVSPSAPSAGSGGMPANPQEFAAFMMRVQSGDRDAVRMLNSMTMDQIRSFGG